VVDSSSSSCSGWCFSFNGLWPWPIEGRPQALALLRKDPLKDSLSAVASVAVSSEDVEDRGKATLSWFTVVGIGEEIDRSMGMLR